MMELMKICRKAVPTQTCVSTFETLSENLHYQYTKRSLTPEQFIPEGLQS